MPRLFFSLLAAAALAAAQRAENLTIGGLPSPALGLDLNFQPHPAFSWQLTAAQSAYRLLVTTATGATAWDSGVVAGAQSTQVAYAGAPLAADSDYTAALTPYFAGAPGAALMGSFSTGPDAAAWAASAQWVGGCTAALAAPQLRRSFSLSPAPILRARAYASGVGLFTLHLNGARVGGGAERVGGEVLSPGWSTEPTVRVVASANDVAALLLAGGENVLGLRLGQGKYGYVFEFCAAGDATCFAGVVRLVITQQGGNTTVIETEAGSGAWQCAPSPITFQHLFDGESYNASLEQAGWDAPGFVPATPWAPATPRAPAVTLLATGVPPIVTAATLAPVSVAPAPGGGHVIAGGQFIIAASGGDPNVYWWADNTTVKNFVVACGMCGLNVCADLVRLPPAAMAALSSGGNFSCSQLPSGPPAYVFDMGRNMAGVCTLTLPPPGTALPGSTLSMVHGEILTTEGAVDNTFGSSSAQRGCAVNSINCADQVDAYTFAAQPAAAGSTFTPSFTFHGFRYVGVLGWPAAAPPPTTATLACHQQHTAMAQGGEARFNSTILNRLQAAIVATQKSNFFSIPSDCPTREKRGWAGDAQVSVGQAMLNLQAGGLYENFVRTMAETSALGCSDPGLQVEVALGSTPVRPTSYQCCGSRHEFGCQPGITPRNATGSLPDVIPFDSISGWPGDFVWSTAGVEIPFYLFKHTGNTGFQQLVFSEVWALLSFCAANTQGGLIRWGPYGDWLAGDGVASGFVENFYLQRAALQAAELASALGYGDRAAALLALSGTVGAALVRDYFDAAHGVWRGSGGMNLQAMGLVGGIGGAATANATGSMLAALLADAAAHGFHTTSGLASSRWILAGLAWGSNASSDAALDMATNPTAPGWGFMVAADDMPGTIWESWGGDAHTSDGSKNHPMFTGGIGIWLYEDALGLSFAHRLQVPPAAAAAAAADAAAAPVQRCPLFPFSPQIRLGLTDAQSLAACTAAQNAPLDTSLEMLHAAIVASAAATTPTRSPPRPPALQPTLTFAPRAAIMRAIGSASGWLATPAGRGSLAWQLQQQPSAQQALWVNVSVPFGGSTGGSTVGRVALPLSLVQAMPVVRMASGAGGGAMLVARVVEGAAGGAGQGSCMSLPGGSSSGLRLSLCSAAPLGSSAPVASLASQAEVEGLGRQHGVGQEVSWSHGALLFQVGGGQHAFSLSTE